MSESSRQFIQQARSGFALTETGFEQIDVRLQILAPVVAVTLRDDLRRQ